MADEFAHWTVNPDGSVSPPGRPEARVEPMPTTYDHSIEYWWDTGAGVAGGNDDGLTFPDAARALLKAMEESDGP